MQYASRIERLAAAPGAREAAREVPQAARDVIALDHDVPDLAVAPAILAAARASLELAPALPARHEAT